MGVVLEKYPDNTCYIKYDEPSEYQTSSICYEVIDKFSNMRVCKLDECYYELESNNKGYSLGESVGAHLNNILGYAEEDIDYICKENGLSSYSDWRSNLGERWNNIVSAGFDIIEKKQLLDLGIANEIARDQTTLFFYHNEVYLEEVGVMCDTETKNEFMDKVIELLYRVMSKPNEKVYVKRGNKKVEVDCTVDYEYLTIFYITSLWNRFIRDKLLIAQNCVSIAA